MGLLITIVVMFNQVNGRIDALNDRIDRLQAETNRRFDALQAENNRRFETVDARFDQMFDRLNQMQEAIMSFDRRASHPEGRLDELITGGANLA